MCFSLSDVTFDGRNEDEPGEEVADQEWDKSKTDGDDAEVPLLVDKRKGLDEHEDERIAEAGQKRQGQDDWLGKEHAEGTDPDHQDFLHGKAFFEGSHLVGAVDIRLLAARTSLLGDAIHHDGCTGFGHEQKMGSLDRDTEDELKPDAPCPVEVLFAEATDDGPKDGATHGGEDDKGNGVLLVVCFPHIGDHAESDGTAGSGETAQGTANHDGSKVGGQGDGKLEEIDEE